jgi:lipopolysaccharide export system permease protein
LGRLSADSEITAMRAAGISLARIARPVLFIGALGGAAAIYINFESMPHARVSYEREFADALRADPMSFIVPKTFIRSFKGSVIYVGEKQGSVLKDIWLWELDNEQRVVRLIRAESGRIDFDEATNSLIPTLVNAKTEERNPADPEDFSKSPKAPSAEKVEEVRLSLDKYFGHEGVRVKREWLTYDELQAARDKLAAAPGQTDPEKMKNTREEQMKLAIVFHDKVNLALSVFSFALIGVPLGIRVSRRETSANLGLALGLVLSYYFLTVMVKWLDRHPEYRPDLLLWLPNLLFLALGVWMFTRIEQRK